MAHDVFISYSAKDKAVADAVCATLEGRKIRCWIAPRDVLPGISYAEALIQALNRSQLLVLVFSASSNKSPQVMREVERAVSKGIPIIPFRIENVTPSEAMEFFLSAPHWLDALTPPLEEHLQRLTYTVQKLLGKDVEPFEEPTPLPPGLGYIITPRAKEYLKKFFSYLVWSGTVDQTNLSVFYSILQLEKGADHRKIIATLESWVADAKVQAAQSMNMRVEDMGFLDVNLSQPINSFPIIEDAFFALYKSANKSNPASAASNIAAMRLALTEIVGEKRQQELVGIWNTRLH